MHEHGTKTTPVFLPADREASTLITATTSVHLPKPASIDLTIKPDSVLTNPIQSEKYNSDIALTNSIQSEK